MKNIFFCFYAAEPLHYIHAIVHSCIFLVWAKKNILLYDIRWENNFYTAKTYIALSSSKCTFKFIFACMRWNLTGSVPLLKVLKYCSGRMIQILKSFLTVEYKRLLEHNYSLKLTQNLFKLKSASLTELDACWIISIAILCKICVT